MGQGTDRAQVVDVARQLTVDILIELGGDLGVLAARGVPLLQRLLFASG
jgi:hypothetical protein